MTGKIIEKSCHYKDEDGHFYSCITNRCGFLKWIGLKKKPILLDLKLDLEYIKVRGQSVGNVRTTLEFKEISEEEVFMKCI